MDFPTDEELLAFADEQLPSEQATAIEHLLREEATLRQRLIALLEQRDQGNLSLGDLWRHQRLSCPSQTELGLYLVGATSPAQSDYLRFHLETIGCVYCQAQRDEMLQATRATPNDQQQRRESLFTSSAGLLKSQYPDK